MDYSFYEHPSYKLIFRNKYLEVCKSYGEYNIGGHIVHYPRYFVEKDEDHIDPPITFKYQQHSFWIGYPKMEIHRNITYVIILYSHYTQPTKIHLPPKVKCLRSMSPIEFKCKHLYHIKIIFNNHNLTPSIILHYVLVRNHHNNKMKKTNLFDL